MIAFLLLAVTLSWDINPEPHLGGYRLYWGTQVSKISMDVGKVNTFNVDNILRDVQPDTTTFFYVTAINTANTEGKPSNEVSYRKPAVPTPAPSPVPIKVQTIFTPTIDGYRFEGAKIIETKPGESVTIEAEYSPVP